MSGGVEYLAAAYGLAALIIGAYALGLVRRLRSERERTRESEQRRAAGWDRPPA